MTALTRGERRERQERSRPVANSVVGAVLAVALAAGSLMAAASPVSAAPAVADAGTWDLVFEKGNRRCRLFLRTEPRGQFFALAMTSVCRKAFPTLSAATLWSAGTGDHVELQTEGGQTLAAFAPDGGGSLAATMGEGETYLLTPISPAEQDRLRAAASAPPAASTPRAANPAPAANGVLVGRSPASNTAAAAEAAPDLPPTTLSDVAGNYAVLRQDRDTGCMVSLEAAAKTGTQRARLAPACRDQGIVVFEPAGWKLVGGTELVLTAKRGHSTALKRKNATTWANAPARGAPLVLKRL